MRGWPWGVALAIAACAPGTGDRDPSPWSSETSSGPSTTADPSTSTSVATMAGTSATATTGAPTTGELTEGSESADSSTGDLGECPAPDVVTLEQWHDEPWVAPNSGNAQQEFRLSTETWRHYKRFELDMDIDVTGLGPEWNCFLELRNIGANQNESHPWRYITVCVKNHAPRMMVHVVYAADDGYQTTPFTTQANTTYHVNVVFDAEVGESTLTMTPDGGSPTTILSPPLTSSITPQGQGLDLWVGFSTEHVEFGPILPPWGWTFRNLTVTMDPGGPFGPLAPACP